MRRAAPALLILMTNGCLAPGERDPTRYPWDSRSQPALAPAPRIEARGAIAAPAIAPAPPATPPNAPPPGIYCVIALDPGSNSGITMGGKPPAMGCTAPVPPAAARPN